MNDKIILKNDKFLEIFQLVIVGKPNDLINLHTMAHTLFRYRL